MPGFKTSVDVDGLPPSAKYVVYVLENAGGRLPRQELKDRTGLAERTLDVSVDRLEDADVVRRDRATDDLRCVHIELIEIS